MSDERTIELLRMCYDVARGCNDPSTQNGAIIVDANGEVIGKHFTRFPIAQNAVLETPERWNDREIKYKLVVHAEAGAVFDCARNGKSPVGGKMYACWAACTDCARAIIEARVTELVAHDSPQHRERPDWAKSIEFADKMMEEAGIKVTRVQARLGKQIRFAGRIIEV